VFLAQEGASEGGGSLFFPLLMIVGLFAIFYFLLIRPNRRRRQVVERLQSELSVGDEVMTSSGLYGTIAEIDEKTVILETSEGVYSRYARGAIMEVVSATGDGAAEPDPTSDSVVERDSKD
jgi:preprotein translocase subunit YajC